VAIPESAKGKYLITTVGKVIFNNIFPDDFPYINDKPTEDMKVIGSWFVDYADLENWAKEEAQRRRGCSPRLYRLAPAQEPDQEERPRHHHRYGLPSLWNHQDQRRPR
jgi:hypothetical protein